VVAGSRADACRGAFSCNPLLPPACYSGGQESDRTMAAWLNAKGARTTRGRAFGKDTVRDMLLNSAYCGYVSGMRSKDR
jgi:hypothetical protein